MATKWRGEIAFPALGKGMFISFPLEDLAELENLFGEDFFGAIEKGAVRGSPGILMQCLSIGLKSRDAAGTISKVWDGIDKQAANEKGFKISDAGVPVMDAISISWLGKTYEELVKEAVEAQKKADAETVKRLKEAAESANIPFSEALSEGLSKLLIGQE